MLYKSYFLNYNFFMNLKTTKFKDLYIVDHLIHGDDRGFFMELHSHSHFADQGLDVTFVQDNLSRSSQGTLRGLHYQLPPHAQGKLVTVLSGEVFDVVVDLRKNEPTFGEWFGITLNSDTRQALYVPPGFAHGFCVLSETADFFYKCTDVYHPESEQSIVWNDPSVGIEWPLLPELDKISSKDRAATSFKNATYF